MASKCFVMGCAIFRLIFLLFCGIGTCEDTSSTILTVMLSPSSHVLVTTATLNHSKTATTATFSIPAHSTTVLINQTTTHGSKPSVSASVHPSTAQPPMHSTVAAPTKPGNHSATTIVVPTPKGGHGNADSRAKWVAMGFAILFFITTVVMTVLFCRQRKIYRELEGDSSLSRLI